MARRPYITRCVDQYGNILPGVSIAVKVHAGGAVANVYAAETGGAYIANGTVTSDSNGWAGFWVDDADYGVLVRLDLYPTLSNYSFTPNGLTYLPIAI